MSGAAPLLAERGTQRDGRPARTPPLPNEAAPVAGKELASPDPTLSAGSDKNIYYWEPKSLRIRTINWWHVFLAEYVHYTYESALFLMGTAIAWHLSSHNIDFTIVWALVRDPIALQVIGVIVVIVAYLLQMKPAVYCIDNIVFVPPTSWQQTRADLTDIMRGQECFSEESLAFIDRMLERSGTGETTCWPPAYSKTKDGIARPVKGDVAMARAEAEAVVFPLVKQLLERTGIKPRDIDFLIVNCSLFTPTPSLCAMICHEFKLRQDVRTYNLGGMGCSANIISVDLAKQLLQNDRGTRAVVISTENLSQNLYRGNDKSMLLQNTLFRCGGCALLLSSRRVDSMRAKYKLLYSFRTQMCDDNAYKCVFEQEDEKGAHGVALSKDIVSVAGQAMKHNFVALGPYVLPLREQAKTLINRCLIHVISFMKKREFPGAANWSTPKHYTPDFTKGIDHFCIHAGGRAVIEGVQKNLNLQEHHVRASKQTLHDWGNTSSSSIWYEVEWVERFGNVKKGDRILQIAFGSGFKCNSAVWLALRVDQAKRDVPLKPNADEIQENAQDASYRADVVDKAL